LYTGWFRAMKTNGAVVLPVMPPVLPVGNTPRERLRTSMTAVGCLAYPVLPSTARAAVTSCDSHCPLCLAVDPSDHGSSLTTDRKIVSIVFNIVLWPPFGEDSLDVGIPRWSSACHAESWLVRWACDGFISARPWPGRAGRLHPALVLRRRECRADQGIVRRRTAGPLRRSAAEGGGDAAGDGAVAAS
jgi:hypothetical protein